MNNLELTKLVIKKFRDCVNRIYEESSFETQTLKAEFIVENIFEIWTYSDSLNIDIANDILEVAEVIVNHQTFEYIKDKNNYKKFIIMANLFNKNELIEWGTSIRGCWFDYEGVYKMVTGCKKAEWNDYKDLNDECICDLIKFFRSDKI